MDKKTNLKTSLVMSLFLLAIVSTAGAEIIYVDETKNGDGLSWGTAYKYLQDALADAQDGDEIWVAAGIYKPDPGLNPDLDAFVANSEDQPNKVWLNDGAGVFSDSGQSLGDSDSSDVELGDMDGDGDLDAFVAVYDFANNKVWLNDGQGNFTDSGQSLGDWPSIDVELGDVDGDEDLDAFVANDHANKVWLNDGQGNFTDNGQSLGSSWSLDVELGDVNGDGDLDAFVANREGNKIWQNDGQGNFTDSGQSLGSSWSLDVELGDVDGDGDLDAFVANDEANKIWLNDGQGNFTDSGQSLGSSWSCDVELGDADGDGDLDAFVANDEANKIWLNDGQGNFIDSGQSLGNSLSKGVALGDVDGDGDLDVFVANYNQANKVWLNDGQGNFTDSSQSLGDSISFDVELGDVDGDAPVIGDRKATFQLISGVTIKGGYAGVGAPDPNARDIDLYKTILSGDIGTPDVNTDNSYHVVTGSGTEPTAVLDGFTITTGYANGLNSYNRGGGMYNNSGSPTVTNCTFSGNYAAGSGGGMFNYQSSPTVTGCKYILNQTDFHGGGIYNQLCSPRVINCVFSQNMAAVHGGGMMNNDYSYPTVVKCTFSQNTAGASGGGMTNSWFSSSTVTNCTFTNNTATAGGGGIYLYASSLTATNCTFSGNTAYSGGGMFNKASSPIVTDCNFSKNTAQSFAGGGMYNHTGSNPIVTNCSFTGNTAANDGGGIYNVDSSPTITNCTFSGNSVYYCGGGIYNLNSSSPFVTNCTFFGNSVSYGGGSYGGGMYNKNSSNPTVTNCIFWNDLNSEIRNIDSSPIFTYSDIQGGTGQLWFGTGCIDADPCFVDAESGDFRPKAGSPCIDAGNNNALPINIMTDLDGKPRFRDDANMPDTGFGTPPIVDMGAYEKQGSPIHNVTQGNYYLHIQQAINDANNGDEIEVAPGTYYEAINFSGKEVRLYSSWGPQATTIDANGAYHVVQCVSGENANTILEGFTITGGNANGSWPDNAGGGMFNLDSSSPTVKNCMFSGNIATYGGGGMGNQNNSSPIVTNCTFSGNTADYDGGGMCNDYSSPTVTNCNFSGNTADYGGGMFNNTSSNPIVTNCTFTGNTATSGGGMYGMYNFFDSSPTVTNCTFSMNTATERGGGMCNNESSPNLTNCTFSGNSAGGSGGGMSNDESSPNLTNCTFTGNTADSGGGMFNYDISSPTVTNCTFSGNSADYGGGMSNNVNSNPIVTNCILWNDTGVEIYNSSSTPTVTYSDVQGGDSWTGNINADPCFIDANSGDFRLKPDSPCIDAGKNTAVPSSVLKDLAGKLRYADDPCIPDTGNAGMTGRPIVDMGAYEFQGGLTTSQNLLANPGFELGNATGWITNWGWNLTATAVQVHDGNYSGLASGRTDSWQGAWQSVLGLMDDGKTYRISGWVRLQDSDSNYVALTVKKVDSTGDHYYGIDNAMAYSDKWVNLDGTLNFDANESMTDLYIYFEGPAADVNFFVDDAAVTEVKGDMDHNGRVDFIDFSLFASYYGFDCSTQDCGRANLDDSDNTINERDLAILAGNWLAGTEPEL